MPTASPPAPGPVDVGLLSPGWAGTPVEAATGDTAWLRAMLDAEVALTRAQAALGLAPPGAAAAVAAAAADLATSLTADLSTGTAAGHSGLAELAREARASGNPVIGLVRALTRAVAERDPVAVDHVHAGATSQDILDTAAMLVADRALALVVADLDDAAVSLARLAAEHRDTVMAGRTLTQHAVPTTFGLKVVGWRRQLLTARDRLTELRATGLPAQLAGAAGTLAGFGASGPRLVAKFARDLGLAEPVLPWHTLRLPVADLAAALALTAGALGKIAADVLVLSRTEIGEVAEGGGGGSSAMPHKVNPVRATLMASAARQVPALASVLFGALAAEDERPAGAWHAEWQPLRDALRLVGGSAAAGRELAAGLRVDPARMRANLDLTDGLIGSERLLNELSGPMGRARARETVAAGVRAAAGWPGGLAAVLADGSSALGDTVRTQLGTGKGDLADRIAELVDPAGYTGAAGWLVDRALREER